MREASVQGDVLSCEKSVGVSKGMLETTHETDDVFILYAFMQPGSTLVMAKKGVPVLGKPNMRGDQLVKVQVEIPKTLSIEERDLVEKLSDLSQAKAATR